MKIKLYDSADLEKIVAKGAKGFPDRSAWAGRMVAAFAGVVRRSPLAYRSFGPFWWPLKAMMVSAGELAASAPDPDLVAQVTTGSAALDVAAAWAQHEAHSSQMLAGSAFTVDTEDGDTMEYLLIDKEMEAMAALKG